MGIFPNFRGENSKKYLSCHHPVPNNQLVFLLKMTILGCEIGGFPTILGNTYIGGLLQPSHPSPPQLRTTVPGGLKSAPWRFGKTAPKTHQGDCQNETWSSTKSHQNISQMLHGTGIFTYISPKSMVNVGKYSIHGSYGYGKYKI